MLVSIFCSTECGVLALYPGLVDETSLFVVEKVVVVVVLRSLSSLFVVAIGAMLIEE